MPPEVVKYLHAESVWTGGLRELRHHQENSPRVVAEVYQAKQEWRRLSDQRLRQRCAELRLYCRCWDSLRIGPNSLLTMSVAATQSKPQCTERTQYVTASSAAGTKILLGTARGNGQIYVGVMNTTRISTFALAESQMRFMRRKQNVLATLHNHAVRSFLMLMQPRVDVLRNSKHYHSHSKSLTILDRGVS